MTAEDHELSRPDWRAESPLLLTRAQAARLCQVSEEILDQWSYEPGFPVIRRNGGYFVRIHRAALERWLEQYALVGAPRPLRHDDRRRDLEERGQHWIADQTTSGSFGSRPTRGKT